MTKVLWRGPFLDPEQPGNCDPVLLDANLPWSSTYCGKVTERYIERKDQSHDVVYLCDEHKDMARKDGLIA